MKLGQTSLIGFLSTVGASLLGFLATVYITRTLGAGGFGEYVLVVAVVTWLQVFGVMGVQSAVAKRLSEVGDDDAYFTAGAAVVFAAFVVMSALILAFRGYVNAYLGIPVAVLIPPVLFASMAMMYVRGALRGQHMVHVAAFLEPVDRVVRSGLQIGAVALGLGVVGLLYGYIVAALVATVVGVFYLSISFTLPERRHVASITAFARYSWLNRLSSRAFSSMDTVVLGAFVVSDFIGYYEASWNLASMLAVFGVAISQAVFPEMSRISSEGDVDQVASLVTDALAYTGLLLIPGFVGVVIVGDRVLAIYGPEFARASTVLVVLVVARTIYAYGSQFTTALDGLDRPRLAFRINAAFVATNVVLNVVLVSAAGWMGAAVATAASAVITLVLGYRRLSSLVPVELPVDEIARQWLAAAVMGVVVYAGRTYLDPSVPATLVVVALGAAVYFGALFAISNQFRTTVRRNLPIDLP